MFMLQYPCHLPVSSCPIDALTHRVASAFFEFCQDVDVHAAPMCALTISRETHTIVTISRETHATVTISRETHATVTIYRETHATVTISRETNTTVTISRETHSFALVQHLVTHSTHRE